MSDQSSQSDTEYSDGERFKEIERKKEKYDMFTYVACDIPLSKNHQNWHKKQSDRSSKNRKAKGKERDINTPPTSSPEPHQHDDIPPHEPSRHPEKWGQILNQSTAATRYVRVEEDTGSSVNFISPSVVEACNLDRNKMKLITFESVAGGVAFTANEWVKATWLGREVLNGEDVFYIAPKTTSIELLVGRDFLKQHPDVFLSKKPTQPAYLNVMKRKLTKAEQEEMERNRAEAKKASDKLQEAKRQAAASSSKGGPSTEKN